ncbi:MAG: hypothetical protein SGBAC_013151, partial [Bacillariaceae sp.]
QRPSRVMALEKKKAASKSRRSMIIDALEKVTPESSSSITVASTQSSATQSSTKLNGVFKKASGFLASRRSSIGQSFSSSQQQQHPQERQSGTDVSSPPPGGKWNELVDDEELNYEDLNDEGGEETRRLNLRNNEVQMDKWGNGSMVSLLTTQTTADTSSRTLAQPPSFRNMNKFGNASASSLNSKGTARELSPNRPGRARSPKSQMSLQSGMTTGTTSTLKPPSIRGFAAAGAVQYDEQTTSTLNPPSMRLFTSSEEASEEDMEDSNHDKTTSLKPPSMASIALVSSSEEGSDDEMDRDRDRDKAMPLKPPSMASVTLGIEEDADPSTFDHHYGSLPLKPVEKPVEPEQSSDFRDSNRFTSRKTRPAENEEATLFTLTPFQQFDPTKLDAKQKTVARGKPKPAEEDATLATAISVQQLKPTKLAATASSKVQQPQQKEDPTPPKGDKKKKRKNGTKPKRKKKTGKQKSSRSLAAEQAQGPSETNPSKELIVPPPKTKTSTSPFMSLSASERTSSSTEPTTIPLSTLERTEPTTPTTTKKPILKKDGPEVLVSPKQKRRSNRLERIQKRSSEAKSRNNSGRTQATRNNSGRSSQGLAEHFAGTAVRRSSVGSVRSARSDGLLGNNSRRSMGDGGNASVGGAQRRASRTSADARRALRRSSRAGDNNRLTQSPGKRKDILQSPGTLKGKGYISSFLGGSDLIASLSSVYDKDS